jgi:hypothetical protein
MGDEGFETVVTAPSDALWIADVVDVWDGTVRWAVAGGPASPAMLQGLLWNGVTAQRVARSAGGRGSALFQFLDPDLRNGIGQIEFLMNPECQEQLVGPLCTFVAQAFRDFPVRRIMAAVPGDAATVISCLDHLGKVAAHLAGHHWRGGGTYVDTLLYQVDRSAEP